MPFDGFAIATLVVGATLILALAGILWRIERKGTKVPDSVALWNGREYSCPGCGSTMRQGWVLLGKGAIWSARSAGRPGTFASIGSALDNTISLSIPPASNMAWRCPPCGLLLLDHSKLVKK